MAIQRALISVSDKTGLEEFAKGLHEFGVELISTGGTAAFLKGLGLPVIEISDYTGEPELFEGRLKTLHPMVHGGLLHRRDNEEHVRQAKENGIKPIDLVCVNLYPFEETVARPGVTLEEAIEKIDIGGPSMLRSAAKNYASVTVVSDPADYARILDEMQTHKGDTTLKTRENLAVKVFMRTSNYDNAITNYLGHQSAESTKGSFCICAPLYQELRYGDNPHQEASLYGSFGDIFHQLQGKELSYTNVLDIEGAAELITQFRRPTVGILKHTNPCGVGQDDEDLRNAWQKAFETDTQAPFGGVIVVNRPMTEGLARVLSAIFTDVIIAPEYDAEARAILQKKKNCRIIRMNTEAWMKARREPIIRFRARRVHDHEAGYGRDGAGQSGSQGGDQAPPDRGRIDRHAFQLACREAGSFQRHRFWRYGPHAWHRRRADEPCGFRPHCRLEGRAGRPGSEGQRCGVRRHVPVCRRPPGGD